MADEKRVFPLLNDQEWKMVVQALVAMEKSVQRLAAKEGQPDSVAAEYRKVGQQIAGLMRKLV